MRALAQMFLGLTGGCEVTIGADEMKAGIEVNMALPCPRSLPWGQTDHRNVGLKTVRFRNFVGCFLIFHVNTVDVTEFQLQKAAQPDHCRRSLLVQKLSLTSD
jgi:hypothetical protein